MQNTYSNNAGQIDSGLHGYKYMKGYHLYENLSLLHPETAFSSLYYS